MDEQENIRVNSKDDIRKEMLRRLREQDPSLRRERSRTIQEKLLSSEEFRVCRTVMTFVSLPTEVNTDYFNQKALEQGKRVAVPYINEEKQTILASELVTMECLEKGPFGIYQPKDGLSRLMDLKEIDLIVVPGVAYDNNNMRLGRGKGFYDQFLSTSRISSSNTIGVAFSFQVLECLPSDPHDKPVSRVITA